MRGLVNSGCRKVLKLLFSRYILGLVIAIFILVPSISVQIPLSLLYKRFHGDSYTLGRAKLFNTARYEQARHYFRHLSSVASGDAEQHRNMTAGLQLVICIITVDRSHTYYTQDKMGYLLQTAAVADHLVHTDQYFKNTSLFICNVQKSPSTHTEANHLKEHIPFIERYGSNSYNWSFQNVTGFVQKHESTARSKEIEDYIYCLNASYVFKPAFILMLEDDIILEKNFFEVLHYTLQSHDMMPGERNVDAESGRKYSFLKLYYPPRWQGYAFELDRLLELVCTGVLGGVFLLVCLYLFGNTKLSYFTSCFYFLLGTALAMYVVFVIGRQNVIELRRLSPQLFKFVASPSCCTPAMLYPRNVVPKMISYLIENSHMNKDLAIAAFTKDSNLPGYYLEPNLAYHIGMYTSLQRAYKPPEEFLHKVPIM